MNKNFSGLIGASTMVLGLVASSGTAKASLSNGSFETGTFVPTYTDNGAGAEILPVGSTTISGWQTITGQVDWDVTPAFGLTAQDGTKFLDLTDDERGPIGGVEQLVALTAGTDYKVTFYIGSSGKYNIGTTQPTITTSIGGAQSQTFTGHGYSAPAAGEWQEFTYDFTVATTGNFMLALQGGSTGSASGPNEYVGLDNVSITAVPEASTAIAGALLLLPFGASALRIWRKNGSK